MKMLRNAKITPTLLLLLTPNSAFCEINYDVALGKAREAAFIQSGAAKFQQDFQNYIENETKKKIIKVGLEKPLVFSLYSYKIYKEKQISVPFDGKRLTISPNSVTVSLEL